MTQVFDAALRAFAPALPLAVGLSGGADSTALLLACAERWPGQVQAIHVHHGLQAAADTFEQHCTVLCARLQVPLTVQRVDARHAPGQSPEDAARIARYKAFEAAVQASIAQAAIQSIALAQHADDQVETLLLALSRGAGVAGLAAMPAQWQRGGIAFHRPLLQVADPRARLQELYAERDPLYRACAHFVINAQRSSRAMLVGRIIMQLELMPDPPLGAAATD